MKLLDHVSISVRDLVGAGSGKSRPFYLAVMAALSAAVRSRDCMRITIAAVGRLKSGPETELANRYVKRFDGSGRALGLGPIKIHELPEARDASDVVRKQDEAGRLLQKAGDGAFLIALDEHGDSLSSQTFADMVAGCRDDGTTQMAFLIGGPDGHGTAVLDAARKTISLGAMTLPHGLARVVLLEQLYRTVTILSGHPYHRA